MRILLVRHGDPNYEKDCLTEAGIKEAKATADVLKDELIDAFYLSPLGRAQETAGATLEARGETGTTCDWLREFEAPIFKPDMNGELDITWDWMPKDWVGHDDFLSVEKWVDDPVMKEMHVATQYYWVCKELDMLLDTYGYHRDGRLYRTDKGNHKTLCFFCHYGVSMVLLSHLINVSPMLLWHGLVAAPASITEICTEERQQGYAYFRMNRMGDTSHLAAAGLPYNAKARFREVFSDQPEVLG